MKKILWIAVGLLAVGLLFYFYQPGAGGTVKIVVSATKGRSVVWESVVNGVQLAIDEYGGKVNGYNVELVTADDGNASGQWQKDLEAKIAADAVSDPDVMAYIGPNNSGAAEISIPITNQGGLLQIGSRSTLPELTKTGFAPGKPGVFYPTGIRNYFRVIPTDSATGAAIWAEELGVKSVIIIDEGEAYGKGMASLFEKKAIELGLNVIFHKSINKGSKDPIVDLGLSKAKADLVFFGGVTPNGAIPLLKGVRKFGVAPKFMGVNGILEQDFATKGGVDAEGVYATAPGYIPHDQLPPNGRKFYDEYIAKYGTEPDPSCIFSYEAAKVALATIKKEGKNRAKVIEGMRELKNYDGALGIWSFDANGDTTLDFITGSRVVNGKFVFQKKLPANK